METKVQSLGPGLAVVDVTLRSRITITEVRFCPSLLSSHLPSLHSATSTRRQFQGTAGHRAGVSLCISRDMQ
jgi:hypothetical protein